MRGQKTPVVLGKQKAHFRSTSEKFHHKGKTVELEDERDVDEENDDLLAWDDSEEPVYIPWQKIKEIKFN